MDGETTTVPRHPLGGLVRSIVGWPLLGLRTTFDTEAERDMLPLPPFEDQVWKRRVAGGELPPIPDELCDALRSREGAAVFMDTLVPTTNGRLRVQNDRGVFCDSSAVVHQALDSFPRGTTVCFLAPASTLSYATHAPLRRDLSERHGVGWLVLLGGGLVAEVHQAFQFALIVCEAGATQEDVVRLVDLREVDPSAWADEVRSAAARRGGEVGHSIVLPGAQLGDGPWVYERYTKAYAASRADLAVLGELRPLSELVESITVGLMPMRSPVRLQAVGEGELEAPPGMLPVLGGREITRTGIVTPGGYWAERDGLPEKLRLEPGDVLFRGITRGPGLVATVVPAGLDATFEHRVLRLRWKAEVPDHVRELLVAWFNSERATEFVEVSALGDVVRVTGSVLRDLEVPYPSDAILLALTGLAKLEAWYGARAEAARNARQSVFGARTYAEAVPVLLEAQRSEGERVTAAEDSQRFDYRVRNYYPHPIALRRERLAVLPHGKDRLEQVLECAEHLVHYLALYALVQLQAVHPELPMPSKVLTNGVRGTDLRMTWGTSWSVLSEAVAATRRRADMLELPFPQLGMLDALITRSDTPAFRAQADLREQRNSQSHLHRLPDSELTKLSASASAALDEMFGAAQFLADLPLVFVRDYELDPFTGQRRAHFEYLRGASVVFERRVETVDRELPRGSLGLLDHERRFHQLAPWLLLDTCEVCKRPEVFLFNRKERGTVTYVAMESGHPREDQRVARAFDRTLGVLADATEHDQS